MILQKIKLQMIKENAPIVTLKPITSPDEVIKLVNDVERYDLSPNKKLIVIGTDIKHNVSIYTEVAMGDSDKMYVSIANIFKPLLIANCSKFLLVHNNVSGNSTPSNIDKATLEKVKEASKLIGIDLMDYLIISNDSDFTSMMNE